MEKDKVVIKVVQNLTRNLQDFPTIDEGLAHNLEQMTALTKRACSEGMKPDFILFNEFPLNHLDVPIDQLPDNGAEMKVLMDKQSRWKNDSADSE